MARPRRLSGGSGDENGLSSEYKTAVLRRRSQVQVQVAVLQINKQAQKCLLELITIQNAVLDRGELFGSVING